MSDINDLDSATITIESKGFCLTFLEWLTKKLKLVEDGATPPNWKYIGLVFISLYSSASTLTFLFPFLPEMILTFGYTEDQKGTYAGLIASSVFAGRIFGSIFWGWLADHKGRKIVLLMTIILNGISAALFGFSTNLLMAMVFRFICGAVNGTVGTSKAILYDISDNTNQAVGMSVIAIAWGSGMIVGPALGGVLASPAVKWPHVFSRSSFFGQFPYLLASLFPCISCVLIFFVIFFYFDETFVVKSSKRKKQELIVSEVTVTEGGNDSGKDSDLPLLSSKSNTSQVSLLALGQSLQSVHLEAESLAYLTVQLNQRKTASAKQLQPLAYKVSSMPHLLFETSTIQSEHETLERSRVFHSMSNITEAYMARLKLDNCRHNIKDLKKESHLDGEVLCIVNDTDEKGEVDDKPSSLSNMHHRANGNATVFQSNSLTKGNNSSTSTTSNGKETNNSVSIRMTDVTQCSEEEENVCRCIESCCSMACCATARDSGFYRIIMLTDVWETVLLYTVFSFTAIALEDIFPVFASTRKDYGGLGFTTDEIGLALAAVFFPQLLLQIKLYPYLVSKFGIRRVFVLSAFVSLVTSQCVPIIRILNNYPVWLWVSLIVIQTPYKISTTCCFAGTSLLVNNSVTRDLAGQVNGLAMMTTAMGRTLAPLVAGALFSWSVTYGLEIGTPFDTSFPFFVIGLINIVCILECLHLNPKLDQQKKRK